MKKNLESLKNEMFDAKANVAITGGGIFDYSFSGGIRGTGSTSNSNAGKCDYGEDYGVTNDDGRKTFIQVKTSSLC